MNAGSQIVPVDGGAKIFIIHHRHGNAHACRSNMYTIRYYRCWGIDALNGTVISNRSRRWVTRNWEYAHQGPYKDPFDPTEHTAFWEGTLGRVLDEQIYQRRKGQTFTLTICCSCTASTLPPIAAESQSGDGSNRRLLSKVYGREIKRRINIRIGVKVGSSVYSSCYCKRDNSCGIESNSRCGPHRWFQR